MDWTYEGKTIVELPRNCIGFVYQLSYISGKSYIGKKLVRTTKLLPVLKNGKTRPMSIERVGKNIKGSREYFDRVIVNKPWLDYEGSSEFTVGETVSSKTIKYLCNSKTTLTYLECRALFEVDAPANEGFLNRSILGKFFQNSLKGLIKE